MYDVAVIGSGFAGSLIAMIASRLGRSVVLLERGRHPRFAIGESSTPLANLLLEELSARYKLPNIAALSKWGTWQDKYPNVGCGLKRGFTFYHHEFGQRAARDPHRQDQLLVAASPYDGIADTHWYRPDVDALLVQEAQDAGVDYLDQVELRTAVEHDEFVELRGTREDQEREFTARFVVDATGPRGFLHRALGLCEQEFSGYPRTQALFTHFAGVAKLPVDVGGIGTPYPVDDAAVHHVFEGGWIWVLRFKNGITSAGAAVTDEFAARLGLSEGAPAWERLLKSLPTVRGLFESAMPLRPFTYVPKLPFLSGSVVGKRWALLPSAAGFVDPLLSTGFPLALLGVNRLAEIIENDWESERFSTALARYAEQTRTELLATAELIGSLYGNMTNFPLFVSLSLLYFATASFAEAARRLGKKELASSFLLCDSPAFKAKCDELFARARQVSGDEETAGLNADIIRTIEPFNVAGLGDPSRRNWYPVEANDLLRAAHKLGADEDEVRGLLDWCQFHQGVSVP